MRCSARRRAAWSEPLFDETSIILLVLAIVVFCLGQILEYGWLLQDESYEII